MDNSVASFVVGFLYFFAITLSGVSGFNQASIFTVVVAGVVFTVGHQIARAKVIGQAISERDFGVVLKLIIYGVVWNSILMSIFFGIGAGVRFLVG